MAVADFVVVRRRNNKQLKMTKQEIKEEYKSTEGDPHMRGARRVPAMAMRRNRMMADVADRRCRGGQPDPRRRRAALRPGPRRPARGRQGRRPRRRPHPRSWPRSTGCRWSPTSRSPAPCYKSCEVGQEIPPDLYRAVATVLAFVMTLKRRGSAAGVHTVRTHGRSRRPDRRCDRVGQPLKSTARLPMDRVPGRHTTGSDPEPRRDPRVRRGAVKTSPGSASSPSRSASSPSS